VDDSTAVFGVGVGLVRELSEGMGKDFSCCSFGDGTGAPVSRVAGDDKEYDGEA
jgi:hypothetical protein